MSAKFDIGRAIAAANCTIGWRIPDFLLKPTHGPCIHCRHDTEDRHGGEWMHDDCNDVLREEQERDYRLDDPRRGQGDRRR